MTLGILPVLVKKRKYLLGEKVIFLLMLVTFMIFEVFSYFMLIKNECEWLLLYKNDPLEICQLDLSFSSKQLPKQPLFNL